MAMLLAYSSLETRWVKTTHVIIESSDIPKAFDGKRIVIVTDIHHGSALSKKRVHKLVQRINDLKPDIIVLGGDYVSNEKKYIKPLFDELLLLKTANPPIIETAITVIIINAIVINFSLFIFMRFSLTKVLIF